MPVKSFGLTAVDWEQRVDFERLRSERLGRLRHELERSELGALLTFDFHNIRYMTSTHIGTWAMDKLIRFALLPRGGEPVIWDFGSAARHHVLYNPWLDHGSGAGPGQAPEHGSRAGISTLRGAFNPDAGRAEEVARSVRRELDKYGLAGEPLGVDVIEMPVLAALQQAGLSVVDGQQVFLEARRVKTEDEITSLGHGRLYGRPAVYDELYAFLRPGVKENECVGLVAKSLYDMGSEHVEGVSNAISGERCSPHPHVYSDRILRPGDPAFFDILHSFMGYRTCYYRTLRGRERPAPPRRMRIQTLSESSVDHAHRPRQARGDHGGYLRGVAPRDRLRFRRRARRIRSSVWPRRRPVHLGKADIRPRLVSFEHPEVLEEGMLFALETYWPAADGWGAARIEEEVLVTADGCEVVTKFPAEELLVAGQRYWTVGGPLSTTREPQSHLNTDAGRGRA